MAFTVAGGGARLAVAEGGAGTPRNQLTAATGGLPGLANGLWYGSVDNSSFALFLTDSRAAAPGQYSGYLLGWAAADGAPAFRRFAAAFPGNAVGATAPARIYDCKLTGGNEDCTAATAGSGGAKFTVDLSGAKLTLAGLPGGAAPLVLLKASQLTPVLSTPPL